MQVDFLFSSTLAGVYHSCHGISMLSVSAVLCYNLRTRCFCPLLSVRLSELRTHGDSVMVHSSAPLKLNHFYFVWQMLGPERDNFMVPLVQLINSEIYTPMVIKVV